MAAGIGSKRLTEDECFYIVVLFCWIFEHYKHSYLSTMQRKTRLWDRKNWTSRFVFRCFCGIWHFTFFAGVLDQLDWGLIVPICSSMLPFKFWATADHPLPSLFYSLLFLVSGCRVSNQEFWTDPLPIAHWTTPTPKLSHASGKWHTHIRANETIWETRKPLWQ